MFSKWWCCLRNKIEKKKQVTVSVTYVCICLCGVVFVCIWVWVRMHLYWIHENCFLSEIDRGERKHNLKPHCFGSNTYIKLTKVCVWVYVCVYVCMCVCVCVWARICVYIFSNCVRRFYIRAALVRAMSPVVVRELT